MLANELITIPTVPTDEPVTKLSRTVAIDREISGFPIPSRLNLEGIGMLLVELTLLVRLSQYAVSY